MREAGLRGVSFDFFVDWSAPSVGDEVWLKRVVAADVEPWPCALPALRASLTAPDRHEILVAARFLRAYGMSARYVAFTDPTDWRTAPRPIVCASVGERGELEDLTVWSVSDLAGSIADATGRDIRVAAMGVTTSDLEVHLATTTGTPWPGDVDRLLLDADTGEAKAIVEFKKHTLAVPIEDHTFARYYRQGGRSPGVKTSDRLKWDRLCLLAERLSRPRWGPASNEDKTDDRLPIIAVYFPTSPGHRYVVVEQIGGPCGELTAGRRSTAVLPTAGDRDSQMAVVSAISDLM